MNNKLDMDSHTDILSFCTAFRYEYILKIIHIEWKRNVHRNQKKKLTKGIMLVRIYKQFYETDTKRMKNRS